MDRLRVGRKQFRNQKPSLSACDQHGLAAVANNLVPPKRRWGDVVGPYLVLRARKVTFMKLKLHCLGGFAMVPFLATPGVAQQTPNDEIKLTNPITEIRDYVESSVT